MNSHLLQDLAIVMMVAGAMTLVCHWLKQPVVLGYLIAGLIVGPHTPPFSLVEDQHSIHTMAELGLVFLMFSLGLEFNLPKLRRVGLSAAFAAFLEVVGMLGIGFLLGRFFGWSKMDSLFLGAILSISSTTIIAKVFMELKMTKEIFAQVVFGILILEDIVAVVILSIMSGLGANQELDAVLPLKALFRVGLFVAFFLILGLLLVPRFLHRAARFQVKEVVGILSLGLCLSGALLAHHFGFSVALGAFLMGAVIAASKEAEQIEHWIDPVRDMFSALFFVAAGMMIQPHLLWEYKWPILIISFATVIGKVFTVSLGSFLAGYAPKTSAKIGMSLAQIGEFSFVIASLGVASKLTSEFLYPLAVMISSLTTFLTPYLIRYSDPLVDGMLGALPGPLRSALNRYHARFGNHKSDPQRSKETMIFSKYLIRLGIYLLISAGCVSLARLGAWAVPWWKFSDPLARTLLSTTFWLAICMMMLPMFAAISKYANHTLLLLVTSRLSWVLNYVNIHRVYNALYIIIISALEILLIGWAASFIPSYMALGLVGLTVLLCAVFLRRMVARATEYLEGWLDDVLGLATSEPTRQAAIKAGEKSPFLNDMMEEIVLPADSDALQQTIRDLKIREQTGASIVAIYRQGVHISNPSPDTTLLPHDILILLGNGPQRKAAAKILL